MEKSIFRYIWRHSLRQQLALTAMAAASFPFLYLFYELPKTIINQAIQGKGGSFPRDIFGIVELDQVAFLLVLCFAFLGLVVVNQAFKYVINVYKGLTGERMLRRLRYDLYARVLRFPLPTFRKMSQGEIIPMITAEVEPLGGFIGDAFSQPAFQGGTLLTILGFLFYQDWRMALAAVLLYPIQIWIIPKLQRQVNELGKQRVRHVRQLSDRIGETVLGVQEIHAHDASNYVLAQFTRMLNQIFKVRYKIYTKKFIIKFVNNFIQQLGPFFFYSIGGYFVIKGELQIGTLVAAIAAHKDLAAPWKELLTYYQQQADATIKYDAVISQFEPPGLRPEDSQIGDPEDVGPLTGEIVAANLTLTDEQDIPVINGLSLRLPLDKRYAIVGSGGSGKDELTLLLARLLDPHGGSLSIGGLDAASMHEAISGRRIAHIGASAFIFAGTIADNLFFGLRHRPLRAVEYDDDDGAREYHSYVLEAERSGNLTFDPNADWVDYAAAGAADSEALRQRALHALHVAAMDEEIYQFGLRGTIDPVREPDLADSIMGARAGLHERLAADAQLATLVETFDRDKYNLNASIAENLLFGNPVDPAFDLQHLAGNPYVMQVLDDVGLTSRFLSVGYQAAATMVELFADLPPDHELFQQFSFISSENLPEIQTLLQRSDRNNLAALAPADRDVLLSLPFKLIPARHRLGLIDETLQAKILEARRQFADNLPAQYANAIEFFDAAKYNAAANIQDNILFGKVAYGQAQAAERVGMLIREVIEQLDLKDIVAEAGLGFVVGIAGSRLSGAQRQKLAIARAVMKRPDVLLLSDATTALDTATQARIMQNLLAEFEGRCLIWAVQRPSMAQGFDEVLMMRQGRVIGRGPYEELTTGNDHMKELLAAE